MGASVLLIQGISSIIHVKASGIYYCFSEYIYSMLKILDITPQCIAYFFTRMPSAQKYSSSLHQLSKDNQPKKRFCALNFFSSEILIIVQFELLIIQEFFIFLLFSLMSVHFSNFLPNLPSPSFPPFSSGLLSHLSLSQLPSLPTLLPVNDI